MTRVNMVCQAGLNVSWSFDPIAFCVALFAVWFAFHEARKSNNVLIKIKKCLFSEALSIDENAGQYFSQLTILIQNRGISLHNLSMSLNFIDKTGCGRINAPLKRKNLKTSNHDEFAKGMLAEFYLKSYQLDKTQQELLSRLENPAKQNACLCVYSQGYLTKTFKVRREFDRLKQRWNNLATKINSRFERQVGTNPEGKPIVKHYKIMSTFQPLDSNIMGFIASLKKGYNLISK